MKSYMKIALLLSVGVFCFTGCSKSEKKSATTKETSKVTTTTATSEKEATTKQAKVDAVSKKDGIKEVVTSVLNDHSSDDFPIIDYISDGQAMFHTNRGFFVYDREKKKLITAIDLKKTGVFSSSSKTETKIQIAEDGSLVRLYLTQGKTVMKDYYFDVKHQKVSGDKQSIGKVYKEDVADAAESESVKSFGGVEMYTLMEDIQTAGQQNSNALFYGNQKIAFLGYPTGVFMKSGDMTKNLSLIIYDVKSKKKVTTPLFSGYASLDTKTKASQITMKENEVWYKQDNDGSLYFDVDELRGTKGAVGTFGKLLIGNVFQTKKGTLKIIFDAPNKMDLRLDPVLVLNSVDESTKPIEVSLDKSKSTYTFKGLKKNKNYYIDYYPMKDSTDDKLMNKIDETNKKLKITISNK